MNELYLVVGIDDLEGTTFCMCTTPERAKKAKGILEAEGFEGVLNIVESNIGIDILELNGTKIDLSSMGEEKMKLIADWCVDTGTTNSSNGSWIVSADEIIKKFNVSHEWLNQHASIISDFIDCGTPEAAQMREEIIYPTDIEYEGNNFNSFSLWLTGSSICKKCGCQDSDNCLGCETAHNPDWDDLEKKNFVVSMAVDGRIDVEVRAKSFEDAKEKAKLKFSDVDLSKMECINNKPVNAINEDNEFKDY